MEEELTAQQMRDKLSLLTGREQEILSISKGIIIPRRTVTLNGFTLKPDKIQMFLARSVSSPVFTAGHTLLQLQSGETFCTRGKSEKDLLENLLKDFAMSFNKELSIWPYVFDFSLAYFKGAMPADEFAKMLLRLRRTYI